MRRVDELARAIIKVASKGDVGTEVNVFDVLPEEKLKALADTMEERFGQPRLPDSGEIAVVAPSSMKVAALFSDRVWSMPAFDTEVPPDISFYGATDFELCAQALLLALEDEADILNALSNLSRSPFPYIKPREPYIVSRVLSESLSRERQVTATPVYDSVHQSRKEYQPGDRATVISSIQDIEVVDESALEWEQVREFRKDKDAQLKYRRMIHWLDDKMVKNHQNTSVIKLLLEWKIMNGPYGSMELIR